MEPVGRPGGVHRRCLDGMPSIIRAAVEGVGVLRLALPGNGVAGQGSLRMTFTEVVGGAREVLRGLAARDRSG